MAQPPQKKWSVWRKKVDSLPSPNIKQTVCGLARFKQFFQQTATIFLLVCQLCQSIFFALVLSYIFCVQLEKKEGETTSLYIALTLFVSFFWIHCCSNVILVNVIVILKRGKNAYLHAYTQHEEEMCKAEEGKMVEKCYFFKEWNQELEWRWWKGFSVSSCHFLFFLNVVTALKSISSIFPQRISLSTIFPFPSHIFHDDDDTYYYFIDTSFFSLAGK